MNSLSHESALRKPSQLRGSGEHGCSHLLGSRCSGSERGLGATFFTDTSPVIRAKSAQGTALPTLPKRLVPGSHPALEFMDEPRHLSMEATPLHLIKARTPPALKAAWMLPVKTENSAWMVSPTPIQPLG